MGHTLAEKIIMKHIGGKSVKPGDLVVVEPDCVVIHDIYTAVSYRITCNNGNQRPLINP